MIAPVRSTPNLPLRRPAPAPTPVAAPKAKAPVAAGGGGMQVDRNGDLVITKNVLGFIPVSATLTMADILRGQYGRDFRLDFTDADHARLTGKAHYGLLEIPVDTGVDLHSGGAVSYLTMHVNDDQTMQVQGEFKLFGWKIPFSVNTRPTQVGPGVFHFTFNSFQVGSKAMNLPVVLAAWTLSLFTNLFSRFDGVQAVDLQRLQVDFRRLNQVTVQQPAPKPQPQSTFEYTA